MWQIITCSLIGLLIVAVRNFQTFFDRSFVSAFELVSAQSFFTCSYLESNLYLCVVFRYRVIFSPQDSNFHLHALLRAAGYFSLLRRKITPYLHII